MYHIVVFEDTNEVEVTAATWAEDGSCMRPSAAAGWMPDGVRAIFTSNNEVRWELPEAVKSSDTATDDDSPIKPKRRRMLPPFCPISIKMSTLCPISIEPSTLCPISTEPSTLCPISIRPSTLCPISIRPSTLCPISIRPSTLCPISIKPQPICLISIRLPPFCPISIRLPPFCPFSIEPPPFFQIIMLWLMFSLMASFYFTALLKNILINQEFMMNQIKIIHKEIKGLYTTSSDELLLKLFPLNNRQSVEDMEAELHENPELQEQLSTALALRGGGSLSECVGRIMTALLTHSLSKQINWRGVNGKMGFQHLQIKKLVTVAVRRNQLTSMETDRDIDLAITKWLQNASDRNGGRQERRKRSVQQRGGDC
ncbi:PREDICTED: uncharacterized protein LOC106908037 [Poecilia mexicana]|uniref:uncharacterized protein LOC106908037 n=1 Tax=Poecilia mexicana TaxID=48701 RepID=UPI00072D9D3C|nr:PREDICTED: uncharacterized protein LOC106908037 [Poecilia mexicana]